MVRTPHSVRWLLPIMTTHTGLVGPGGHRNDNRRAHRVAQANDLVGKRCGLVETFDFSFQVTQFTQGTLQAWRRAYQTDIVPHEAFDHTHVLLNEGGVGRALAHSVPGRDVGA